MDIKNLVGSYILCSKSRIIALFGYPWPALISFFIASSSYQQGTGLDLFKLIVSLSLMSLGVYLLNDLKDLDDDLKNLELGNPAPASRPLGSGKVTEERMRLFVIVNFISSLVVAYFINLTVFGLDLIFMLLGIMYSVKPVRLKERFILKQLTITMGAVLSVLMGAYTAGGITMPIMFMVFLEFLLGLGVNPIMDMRDVRGDRLMGVKTLPVVWGPELTMRLYMVSLVVILGAGLLGYSMIDFNIAMPLLILMITGAWIYTSLPLLKKLDDPLLYGQYVMKRAIPFYMMMQIVPLVGVLNLPF